MGRRGGGSPPDLGMNGINVQLPSGHRDLISDDATEHTFNPSMPLHARIAFLASHPDRRVIPAVQLRHLQADAVRDGRLLANKHMMRSRRASMPPALNWLMLQELEILELRGVALTDVYVRLFVLLVLITLYVFHILVHFGIHSVRPTANLPCC
ncbi:hypothetical protein Vretimale_18022 [Volvox reticuliferus]|uniref:Uncharacterized protein n=1 Tax=Volvox reticuliferus TaxID=1737510 RepID=A0A8J4CZ56_9CHLO|nr:hypothetical protein Vretifemale_19503 [Volvox reticuliferus]GIM15337.1 hypothetical protein Vretimale_18022 [Volvox reticuliferus]